MFSANSSQVSDDKLFVEDVFSTYLYTGNGSTQTITNGIDLAGKGGMVWIKDRSAASSQRLYDTTRGANNAVFSNLTNAQTTVADSLTAFNSNGFTVGSANGTNGNNYASWTFREAPKFFDVVTYTGDGTDGRAISHNLGIAPGCVIIKRTDTTQYWAVAHRGNGTTAANAMSLNDTTGSSYTTFPVTSTTFTVSTSGTNGIYNSFGQGMNANGGTYVAYLFAHDTTSDGIIQCGSFTTDGSGNATVNLGWEPQWLLLKDTANGASNWITFDTMRGLSQTAINILYPNTSGSEIATSGNYVFPTATGFQVANGALGNNAPNIYIAIRRGPMRTPTSGTSVFSVVAQTGTGAATTINHGFPVDAWIASDRDNSSNLVSYKQAWFDRILGNANGLRTASTLPWSGGWGDTYFKFDNNTGIPLTGNYSYLNNSGTPHVYWAFRRAPSFFDEVCWNNTSSTQNISHNLKVVPELIITKRRDADAPWQVYSATTGASSYLTLSNNAAVTGNTDRWNATSPTAAVFTTGSSFYTFGTYIAYLFASCPGVSKVGSYTGNGSSQTINCGFTNGARFVLIKRTDDAGSWFVWDTARGITSGNDPYLRLDSTLAEAGASYNSIDPNSSGFVVVQSDAAQININGATYIYLAVA